MKVFAIDQSTRKSGWCLFDGNKIIDVGVVSMPSSVNVQERTKEMFLALVKLISSQKIDLLVVEGVQRQANENTMIILSSLRGMLIGYAYYMGLPVESPMPVEWRSRLKYKQGPKIKREELKQQSIDYVKNRFGVDLPEDAAEAVCIACSVSD